MKSVENVDRLLQSAEVICQEIPPDKCFQIREPSNVLDTLPFADIFTPSKIFWISSPAIWTAGWSSDADFNISSGVLVSGALDVFSTGLACVPCKTQAITMQKSRHDTLNEDIFEGIQSIANNQIYSANIYAHVHMYIYISLKQAVITVFSFRHTSKRIYRQCFLRSF